LPFGHRRLLPARVTHLEMVQPCDIAASQPSLQVCTTRATIAQVINCPVHFYRYLYDRIGRSHHWGQRLKLRDKDLSALLCSPETVLHVLTVDGCPAGFCEISLGNWPCLEIVYFGLMAEFQGHGWGRLFLTTMIEESWRRKPERLIIQTNTLDSPRALKLYQSLGFQPVLVRDVMMEALPPLDN